MTEEERNEEIPVGSEESAEAATNLIRKTAEFLGAVECAAVELVVDAANSYVTDDLAEKVVNQVAECLEEVDWDDRVGDHASDVDLTDLVKEKVDEELEEICWDDMVGEAIGEVDISDALKAHIDATLDDEGLTSIGLDIPFQIAIKGLMGEGVVDNFEAKWQDLVDTSTLAYSDCEKLTNLVDILRHRLDKIENRGVRGWWRRVKAARAERRYQKAKKGATEFHHMVHGTVDDRLGIFTGDEA